MLIPLEIINFLECLKKKKGFVYKLYFKNLLPTQLVKGSI